MSFENQNARAKITLQLSEGVLIEIPLAVVIRAIQDKFMTPDPTLTNLSVVGTDPEPSSVEPPKRYELAVKNLRGEGALHLVVTTKEMDQ